MTLPSLAIVVPTHDRPTLLPRALDGLLRQSMAPHIIVADDSGDDRNARVLAGRYADRLGDGPGLIRHVATGATTPWGNWRAGAEAATTGRPGCAARGSSRCLP